VQKWLDQSSQHKSSTADKCGGTVWDVRVDLEAIGGGGGILVKKGFLKISELKRGRAINDKISRRS
jgi:hypothetical protein